MKDLNDVLKELELVTLNRFIDLFDKNLTLRVYYFSPDDYHTYLGFQVKHNKGEKPTVTCQLGNFYVNKKKQELFIDNPTEVFSVPIEQYKKFYNTIKKIEVWNVYILSTYTEKMGVDD